MQDFTDQLAAIRRRLDEAAGYLRIAELEMRQPQLEVEASRPDLWDDQDKARKVTSELAAVNEDLELFARLSGDVDDADTLHEMAREEGDESLEPEIAAKITAAAGNFTASKGADEFAEDDLKARFQSSFPPEAIDNIKWYPPVPAGLEDIEGKILDRVQAS